MVHNKAWKVALLLAIMYNASALHVHSATPKDHDLVFAHVPMNYGNPISEFGVTGGHSGLSYDEVTGAGKAGWAKINSISQPDPVVWGPMNPDLQNITEYGCPQYYTPQKFWPKELAERYFGKKTVFGMLRDPYDRLMAAYRGTAFASKSKQKGKLSTGVQRGWDFEHDGQTCDFSSWVKLNLADPKMWSDAFRCQMQPQASFFEGPYAIEIAIDNREFPLNANKLLAEHGYTNINMQPENMMHVTGCDNTWSGDLDDEAKQLIKTFYARDFELLCEKFGHCDRDEKVCCNHVPGMCPHKLFNWNEKTKTYIAK